MDARRDLHDEPRPVIPPWLPRHAYAAEIVTHQWTVAVNDAPESRQ
jgi:hypothetical protein